LVADNVATLTLISLLRQNQAGAVGLALWFLHGVKKSELVPVTREVMKLAACKRQSLYASLAVLEGAGLIQQHKHAGRRTRVTLLTKAAWDTGL
jgi:hypothetical protein